MPEIKIKHVVSFSSEDKVHKAENILKSESYRKWKCATPGEKNASIVLQFEKATKIHSIDIGNECSAFVEILVGRSSDSVNDFQVLLVASSFMSPLESRNENHTNRVRMFDADKLSQNVKDDKWDCVQVVCTQPFNKNITYGLSFIKFHSPPEKKAEQPSEAETKPATTKLGAFQLKYDDEDDDIESSPGLSWKQNKESAKSNSLSKTSSQEEPSFAASVLASSSSQSKPGRSDLSEYERRIAKNKQEQKDFIKALKIQEAKKEFSEAVKELKEDLGTTKKRAASPSVRQTTPLREKNSPRVNPLKRSSESHGGNPNRRKDLIQNAAQKASSSNNSNKVAKVEKKKPFNKIMDNVVFAISGFVNPMRGEIRDKALEMGAKYKGDWDRTCTHLVCAFINTPKYIQVRGDDGRVVTKEWVTECYNRKALLPWRSYMLGKYSKDSSEGSDSDEETSARKDSPKANGNQRTQKPVAKRRAKLMSSSSDSDDAAPPSKQQKSKPTSLFGEIDEDEGEVKPGPSKTNKQKPNIGSSDSDSAEDKFTPSKLPKSKSIFGDMNENNRKPVPSTPRTGLSMNPARTNTSNQIVISDSDSQEGKSNPSHRKESNRKSLFGETNGKQTSKRMPAATDDSETEDEDAIRDYLAATDVDEDSGGDTEDEIRKVEQARKKKLAQVSPPSPKENNSDSEESQSLISLKPDTTEISLPELPNLFKKRHFYLYGEFSSKKRHDLQRFITAYNGIIDNYMGDTVKYVVTDEGWDKNFDDAFEENEDLLFVKPEWVFKCHDAQKLVPYQAYLVTPS